MPTAFPLNTTVIPVSEPKPTYFPTDAHLPMLGTHSAFLSLFFVFPTRSNRKRRKTNFTQIALFVFLRMCCGLLKINLYCSFMVSQRKKTHLEILHINMHPPSAWLLFAVAIVILLDKEISSYADLLPYSWKVNKNLHRSFLYTTIAHLWHSFIVTTIVTVLRIFFA